MKTADGTPMDLRQWRKEWSHPPTPIPANATGLWYSEECVDQMLADYAKLAEERVRVLREALSAARVHIADCDCINSACGEDCIYKFIDAALATPAPETAQQEKENAK